MKLLLIPTLALLAGLLGGATAAPAAADTHYVPRTTVQTIYAGFLQNNWQYWGWAATNLANHTPALSATSIAAQAGAWQAVYLHHAPMQTSSRTSVAFWINGGKTGGQTLVLRALRSGAPQTGVPIAVLKPNRWQQVSVPLASLGVGSVPDLDGLWIQNNSATSIAPFYVDKLTLVTTSAPVVLAPPAAPTGLAATPQWAASCPTCGGMAMAHLALTWSAVSGASSYTVYRNGVKQVNQAAPGWTDMSVTSGQSYSYTVSATGTGGESSQSLAVSAVAPNPPATALTAPVNLTVAPVWTGAPGDKLTWAAVPGAASYNVYQYSTLIGANVSATSFAVLPSVWGNGLTYSVSAVDAMGMETLPSAIATAQGGQDPAQAPGWNPASPIAPTAVTATPEWNAGHPRIHLVWQGASVDYTYTLYRDGQPVAAGLWGLSAYDSAVQPGETHSYTVTGSNVVWTQGIESAASAPVSATALSGPPAPAATPVQITNVVSNDDSVLVSFAAVPGAVDYRVYNAAAPGTVKYSGGSLSVEMNGLNPAGATLVVEAVDKLGPFQTMDGMAGPGAMQMDGMHQAINGQGDPSNIPLVLASSAPFPVSLTPASLTGSQKFFDTFRGEQPLAAQPMPALVPNTFYGDPVEYAAFANDKWTIRNYGGDLKDTKVFFMGSHFMDTLYDGGTPGTNDPLHNNNGSLVMMPNSTADISGGKVLHVTFEVDSHMDDRRWCDVFVGPAGDTLINPGKFADSPGHRPTTSGQLFRWEIHQQAHQLSLFPGAQADAFSDIVRLTDQTNGVGPDSFGICARSGLYSAVPFNGTAGDLDKRHKFDLYLSQTRAVIMEQGRVCKDVTFPAGTTLPFDKCQVYFVHQVYHTGNDRPGLIDYDPADSYWINNRPWADERHWDDMGYSVLDAFPTLP